MVDGPHDILSPYFDAYAEPLDIPFVIRETARKTSAYHCPNDLPEKEIKGAIENETIFCLIVA